MGKSVTPRVFPPKTLKTVSTFSNLAFSKFPNLTQIMFQRKTAICSRCQTIMYSMVAPITSRGTTVLCDHSACQIMKDTVLYWTGHSRNFEGISEEGTYFYPIELLKMLQELYERLVVDRARGVDSPYQVQSPHEDAMLGKRTTTYQDGCSGFLPLISPSRPPHPINLSYFVTAANTCVLTAFRDD